MVGLVYKVMLANQIAALWNDVMVSGVMGINTATAWLGAWGYSMQIYFDFLGYSLMAIGMGYMLGFRFPKNFSNPYCAVSVTDFWRRWHITLGRWFREYVYIPLGGNKKDSSDLLSIPSLYGFSQVCGMARHGILLYGECFSSFL